MKDLQELIDSFSTEQLKELLTDLENGTGVKDMNTLLDKVLVTYNNEAGLNLTINDLSDKLLKYLFKTFLSAVISTILVRDGLITLSGRISFINDDARLFPKQEVRKSDLKNYAFAKYFHSLNLK